MSAAPSLFLRAVPTSPLRRSVAFTLIELLVAMTVFAILVVMLMGLVDSASKLWRQSENRMDSYREARAAMAIISHDLRNALASTNTNYIIFNENAFPYFGNAETNTNSAGAILFLAAQPENAQQSGGNKSDVTMVGYFLAYGNSSLVPGPLVQPTMNLYRYFRSSDDTFRKMSNSSAPPFDNPILIADTNVELLARNISSFRITPLDTNYQTYVSTTNAPLPPRVRVEMIALNKDAAKILTTHDAWTNGLGGQSNVINQNSQTFSTLEHLVNK